MPFPEKFSLVFLNSSCYKNLVQKGGGENGRGEGRYLAFKERKCARRDFEKARAVRLGSLPVLVESATACCPDYPLAIYWLSLTSAQAALFSSRRIPLV
jgi:hypothetical protein